ncbi:uncharacterized protein LOC110184268 [Drosophila serrata]|uniref:uncharacterized protein LOC110184268 n=1 Tax=Drosophila serrata TaxID=7274 RepID=UPI000A1D2A99|nr:uncharacterized protein LOC110184268 [Drosophila serrata]
MEENIEDADYQLAVSLHKHLNGDTGANHSQADENNDLQFAKRLQAEINDSDMDNSLQFLYPDGGQRANVQNPKPLQEKRNQNASNKSAALTPANDYLNQTQHLVHPEWELVDPNPDIYSMFQRFNAKFFQDRLGSVVLEWSKRMYSCAGICYQRSNRYIQEVTIRLSEPLLKLRPRKDLVETLLHEMIHAYFFILNVREGNGGHGPNFKQKMQMINKVAGTNITVYHSFHDEVDAYRTHIWRCNGICQNHTPFKGWVKRTSNRAPGPNDQWWAKHQRDCGGTFMKVSGPSKPPKAPKPPKDIKNAIKAPKKALPAVSDPKSDIRDWFNKPPAKKLATDDAILGAVVPTKSQQDRPILTSQNPWPNAKPKNSGSNIRSFGDLNRDSDEDEPPAPSIREKFPSFKEAEQGYTMPKADNENNTNDALNIREIRERRFGQKQKCPPSEISVSSKTEAEQWERYDEDVLVRDAPKVVIDLVDDNSSVDDEPPAADLMNNNEQNLIDNPEEPQPNSTKRKEDETFEIIPKKRRREASDSEIQHWESTDEINTDAYTATVIVDSDTDDDEESMGPPDRRFPMSSQERSQNVKREVLEDESIGFYKDNILFIDDEYNDDERDESNDPEISQIGLGNHESLLWEFRQQNDVVPSWGYHANEGNDIVSCPICFDQLKRSDLDNHLDGCSITQRVAPPSFKRAGGTKVKTSPPGGSKRKSSSTKEMLRKFGYTESDVSGLDLSSSSDTSMLASEDELTPRQRRQRNLFKPTVGCPKCGQELMGHQLDAHRNICPGKKRK